MIKEILNFFGYVKAPTASSERWDFQGCVCSPGREMELAIEDERHYQVVERIRQADLRDSIAAYHGRERLLPVVSPQRRTVPQLPAPTTIEVSEDGIFWFTIDQKETVNR